MKSTLLSAVLAVSVLAIDSPLQQKRTLSVQNSYDPTTFRNADGTVNQAFLKADFEKVARKYNVHLPFNTDSPGLIKRKDGGEKKRSGQTNTQSMVNQGIQYTAIVGMGTPTQSMVLNLDTGSADLWVATQGTAGVSKTFNTGKSSTYQGSTTPFSIQYGSGTVAGTLANDTVTLAGFTVPQQVLGAVKVVSTNFIGGPDSGILGMGFQSISTSNSTPFFQNVMKQGILDQNQFGFYLTRNSSVGSTVTLGGSDITKYTGDVAYSPVAFQSYWQLNSTATVNDVPIGYVGAAIDTATTFIYAPIALTQAIYAQVPGATSDTVDNAFVGSNSYYQYPCNNTFSVGFTFPGIAQPLYINPIDFNIGVSSTDRTQCIGAIIGMDIKDFQRQPIAIVGDSFLRGWYSIYNFNNDGSASVGFAKAI